MDGSSDHDPPRGPGRTDRLGRYELVRVVGSGGFATVWEGYDPEFELAVAIKVLAENWALNADVRERFLAEARLLRQIDDPRVIKVRDLGLDQGRPYFVMDLITGGTMADLIARRRDGTETLAPAAALTLAARASYAVQALHEAGLVHRDVKPGNLLLTAATDGEGLPSVVVADLGSAKLLEYASGLTVTIGTPAYMAPEQVDHRGGLDGRADVYALAVVTFELLTGSTPFAEITPGTVAQQPDAATRLGVAADLGLHAGVDELLASALSRDPSRRPASARIFGEALEALGAGRSPAPRDTSDRRPRRETREWPTWMVASGAFALFLLATYLAWRLR